MPDKEKAAEASEKATALKENVIRLVTVFAYVSSVSMAALCLSSYYVFFWEPKPPGPGPPVVVPHAYVADPYPPLKLVGEPYPPLKLVGDPPGSKDTEGASFWQSVWSYIKSDDATTTVAPRTVTYSTKKMSNTVGTTLNTNGTNMATVNNSSTLPYEGYSTKRNAKQSTPEISTVPTSRSKVEVKAGQDGDKTLIDKSAVELDPHVKAANEEIPKLIPSIKSTFKLGPIMKEVPIEGIAGYAGVIPDRRGKRGRGMEVKNGMRDVKPVEDGKKAQEAGVMVKTNSELNIGQKDVKNNEELRREKDGYDGVKHIGGDTNGGLASKAGTRATSTEAIAATREIIKEFDRQVDNMEKAKMNMEKDDEDDEDTEEHHEMNDKDTRRESVEHSFEDEDDADLENTTPKSNSGKKQEIKYNTGETATKLNSVEYKHGLYDNDDAVAKLFEDKPETTENYDLKSNQDTRNKHATDEKDDILSSLLDHEEKQDLDDHYGIVMKADSALKHDINDIVTESEEYLWAMDIKNHRAETKVSNTLEISTNLPKVMTSTSGKPSNNHDEMAMQKKSAVTHDVNAIWTEMVEQTGAMKTDRAVTHDVNAIWTEEAEEAAAMKTDRAVTHDMNAIWTEETEHARAMNTDRAVTHDVNAIWTEEGDNAGAMKTDRAVTHNINDIWTKLTEQSVTMNIKNRTDTKLNKTEEIKTNTKAMVTVTSNPNVVNISMDGKETIKSKQDELGLPINTLTNKDLIGMKQDKVEKRDIWLWTSMLAKGKELMGSEEDKTTGTKIETTLQEKLSTETKLQSTTPDLTDAPHVGLSEQGSNQSSASVVQTTQEGKTTIKQDMAPKPDKLIGLNSKPHEDKQQTIQLTTEYAKSTAAGPVMEPKTEQNLNLGQVENTSTEMTKGATHNEEKPRPEFYNQFQHHMRQLRPRRRFPSL